jgi:alkylhydroperoxidase/carboxymuconolactone decarboxylase family protein YurZ
MKSLGRARGWAETARYSALGDEELMARIAKRCRIILEIIGEDITKPEDADTEEELKDEIVELQKSLDDFEEEFDELLERANVVLTEIYEEPFSTLDAALKALITEYREAIEELEDYETDESEGEYEVAEAYETLSEIDREIRIGERDGLIEKI